MPLCPQCQKPLAELTAHCPSCKADLDLLVEYVGQLRTGVQRAEQLVRAGELDQAVWAYLEVLEVDPDHAEARRQVGRVATAIRAFDRLAPGRRWLGDLRGETDDTLRGFARWMRVFLALLLIVVAFAIGYGVGSSPIEEPLQPSQPLPSMPPELKKPSDRLRDEARGEVRAVRDPRSQG